MLWFAFKLYLWRIEKQLGKVNPASFHCCDLLSNCIFDVLKNNHAGDSSFIAIVVICFQIVSLTYWKTTFNNPPIILRLLWFAFKLYLWRIEKQPCHRAYSSLDCCDLLSNCIFDVLKNNVLRWLTWTDMVVICFQIVSLTYWKTTNGNACFRRTVLWFAFKLYLWRIEKQLLKDSDHSKVCCDLLSNCIFDVLKNNKSPCSPSPLPVVICFQIVSLTYWKTTFTNARTTYFQLWFAFKLYLWRIEKQH